MSNSVDLFLMKSILGRETKPDNPESVIKGCIREAYDDMMSVGRFFEIGDKKSNCEKIHSLLKDNEYHYSRELIRNIKAIFGEEKIYNKKKSYVTSFGLSQKVVNMTYKYLYCFRDFTRLDIDFTQCDCPIDSVVLDDMEKRNLLKEKRTSYVWSKLDENQYQDIQDALNGISLDTPEELSSCSPRMRYDFKVW